MERIQPRNGHRSLDDFCCELAAARQGSSAALGNLLEPLRRYLLVVADSEFDTRLHTKIAPSDLVQETFLEAHRALDEFQGTCEAEWRGWLRQILLNELRQADRAFHRDKRDFAREVRLADAASPGERQLPSYDETPSQRAAAEEDVTRLAAALARLAPDHRQVIELRNSLLSFHQIGQAMHRSEAAAQKLWARAVEKLGEMLKEHGERKA